MRQVSHADNRNRIPNSVRGCGEADLSLASECPLFLPCGRCSHFAFTLANCRAGPAGNRKDRRVREAALGGDGEELRLHRARPSDGDETVAFDRFRCDTGRHHDETASVRASDFRESCVLEFSDHVRLDTGGAEPLFEIAAEAAILGGEQRRCAGATI